MEYRPPVKKRLFAFDFDDTIVDENSDIFIKRLAPEGKLPAAIEASYSKNGWIEYMNSIFLHLHACNVSRDQMRSCIEEIPLTHGMCTLITALTANPENDVIIISDANQTFIDWILQREGLQTKISSVYTNPSTFTREGYLQVRYYHTQNWCELSTVNLCKGHILQQHIDAQRATGCEYSFVAYIGDGTNDYCPGKLLTENDILFARKGYSLPKVIAKNPNSIRACVWEWQSGHDIAQQLASYGIVSL